MAQWTAPSLNVHSINWVRAIELNKHIGTLTFNNGFLPTYKAAILASLIHLTKECSVTSLGSFATSSFLWSHRATQHPFNPCHHCTGDARLWFNDIIHLANHRQSSRPDARTNRSHHSESIWWTGSQLSITHITRVLIQSRYDPNIRDEVTLFVRTGVLIDKLPAPTEELHRLASQYGVSLSESITIDILIGQDHLTRCFLLPVSLVTTNPWKTCHLQRRNMAGSFKAVQASCPLVLWLYETFSYVSFESSESQSFALTRQPKKPYLCEDLKTKWVDSEY